MPQAVKVRSDIEVGCYAYEGVDAVKDALRAGIACGTEEMPIKINLIAPPRYVVTTTTLDKEGGIALLNEALKKIEESIKRYPGIFTVSMAVCCLIITCSLMTALVWSKTNYLLPLQFSPKWSRTTMKLNWPDLWRKLKRRTPKFLATTTTKMMLVTKKILKLLPLSLKYL